MIFPIDDVECIFYLKYPKLDWSNFKICLIWYLWSLNWAILWIYWDRGLAWYDSAFGTQRSRIQISPIPPYHYLIIKLGHNVVAGQWGRVRVMILKWGKLIGSELRHVFMNSSNSLMCDFIEIWEAWCDFDCGAFAFYGWLDSVYRPCSGYDYCNNHVFWNQTIREKKKTIYWKWCWRRNLYGMWFKGPW